MRDLINTLKNQLTILSPPPDRLGCNMTAVCTVTPPQASEGLHSVLITGSEVVVLRGLANSPVGCLILDNQNRTKFDRLSMTD